MSTLYVITIGISVFLIACWLAVSETLHKLLPTRRNRMTPWAASVGGLLHCRSLAARCHINCQNSGAGWSDLGLEFGLISWPA